MSALQTLLFSLKRQRASKKIVISDIHGDYNSSYIYTHCARNADCLYEVNKFYKLGATYCSYKWGPHAEVTKWGAHT